MGRRYRSRDELKAIFAKGKGKQKKIILVLDPSGDERYLKESGRYTLRTNPELLSDAEIANIRERGTPVGYVVRHFESGDKGPSHDRTLKTADGVRKYLDEKLPGTFTSDVEASGGRRVYIQQCYRMPDGSVRRIRVDPDKFA